MPPGRLSSSVGVRQKSEAQVKRADEREDTCQLRVHSPGLDP